MIRKPLNRSHRISKRIKKEIAIILQKKIKDPRIDIITTISKVKMSSDLSHAKIYFSILNENENIIRETTKILKKCSSYIRILLGKSINLRILPEIIFLYDDSLVKANRISSLIEKTMEYGNKNEIFDLNKEKQLRNEKVFS